jgi:fibronectin-binding autotransporter adhesin
MRSRVLCLTLTLGWLSQSAGAASRSWLDPAGGSYYTTSNWSQPGSPATIPGASDTIIFDLSSTYTVTFTGFLFPNPTNLRLLVQNDDVTFSLAGKTYTLSSVASTSVVVGGGDRFLSKVGHLTLLGGTVSAQSAAIGGEGRISSGEVTVSTGATWNNAGVIAVGASSPGTLTVINGGDVSSFSGIIGDGGTGTATVTGNGSTWANSSSLDVGGNSPGSLTIQSGGFVSNTDSIVGTAAGNGSVTVTGAGSHWASNGPLTVGFNGTGSLAIAAGGRVDGNAFAATRIIGDQSTATGTVTVDGANSQWISTNSGQELRVGNVGSGSLAVTNGGNVYVSGSSYIGYNGLGNGTADVHGSGATWDAGFGLYVGGGSSASGGTATLTVGAGGTVSAQTFKIWPPGTVNLSGGTIETTNLIFGGGAFNWTAGTLHLSNTLEISPAGLLGSPLTIGTGKELHMIGLSVGSAAAGALVIPGGAVLADGDAVIAPAGIASVTVTDGGLFRTPDIATIGDQAAANGTVSVDGAGSRWDHDGPTGTPSFFIVGNSGTGSMNATGGGVIAVHNQCVPVIANNPGSHGSVTVDGAGSQWTTELHDLSVGYSGSGTLSILNGGSVATISSGNALIGDGPGSDGTTTVDGPGSTWTVLGLLDIGNAGTGSLKVTTGAAVSAAEAYIALQQGSKGDVTVEGAGASFRNIGSNGYLIVGGADAGSLTIKDGGTVEAKETFVGDGASGIGTVLVSGAGASLVNSQDFAVGYFGQGIVSILAGASASNPVAVIGNNSGSVGRVTVDGAGSTWTNTDTLDVGPDGSGALTVSGGAAMSVTNTLTIWSHGTVTLNGGTINAGTVDLTAGAVLGGTGTIASNVSNAGSVSPGQSPGLLTVNGNYTQAAGGSLECEIGGLTEGTEFDSVAVSGSATLDGTLNIHLINGFVPTIGRRFMIMTFGSRVGQFAAVTGTDIGNGLTFSVEYGPANITLVAGPVVCHTPASDADGDGDVDLNDFLQFQACFNGPNRPWLMTADSQTCACLDADRDADVDLADFLVFQGCFNGPNRTPACP